MFGIPGKEEARFLKETLKNQAIKIAGLTFWMPGPDTHGQHRPNPWHTTLGHYNFGLSPSTLRLDSTGNLHLGQHIGITSPGKRPCSTSAPHLGQMTLKAELA
jgi:hypothetical protein